jgi:hypothetical protein
LSANALIAVLGADSPVGDLLIDALADAGHARRAVLAVPTADVDDALPRDIAVAFADGTVPGAAARLAELAGQGVAALGLNGAGDAGWPIMIAAEDELPASQLRLASSGWVLLASLLRPLHAAFGVTSAHAVVLQPASERGSAALEILGQQTAAVLNFRDPPVGVYPQRIAFNTQPVAPSADVDAACAAALWSGAENAVRMQMWDVPVFVGLSMSLFVTLRDDVDAAAVEACLAQITGVVISRADDEVPTPVTLMAAEGTLLVRDVHANGRGLQFAVVADNLGIGAAQPAARLLRRLCEHTVA